MRQSELTRLTAGIAKKEAAARGWRSIAGQPYWREGPLFFTLLFVGTTRPRQFTFSLRFKWYDFDTLLWRILGLTENLTAPESLRANGAFALPGQEVLGESTLDPPLTEAWLSAKVQDIAELASVTSATLRTSAGTLVAYMAVVEQYHLSR